MSTVTPTIMQFSFGEEILNTGDSVAVNCMVVKGDSPLEIRWYLNGAPISSENEGILVTKLSDRLSSLSIEAIQPIHRGVYECRVKNRAAETVSSAELVINGTWINITLIYVVVLHSYPQTSQAPFP